MRQLLESCTDGSVQVRSTELAARIIVTCAAAFIYTDSLARAEGDDGARWIEFTHMIEGYLS